ncbi:MAG: signal peptidase II [Lachnospiraceae bacterium]|nr:signal peptidase II [Lachnospiraceae bacterium]
MKTKQKTGNIKLILSLIGTDILIKLIIRFFLMERKFYICEKLGFTPFLNTKQLSIFNNELQWNMSMFSLILLNVGAILAVTVFWCKMRKEEDWTRPFDLAMKLLLSGAVCSFVDKLFWGGSLDYLLIHTQIADLKDIYLVVGVTIYLAEMFRQIFRRLFLTYI